MENEYPQHMFLWRTGENYPSIIIKYPPYLVFCLFIKYQPMWFVSILKALNTIISNWKIPEISGAGGMTINNGSRYLDDHSTYLFP